jgi:DNA-binding MarR family transcriptional regulator
MGQLLRDAGRAWEAELFARQERAGLEGNRPRFSPVLRHLDADERGTRLTQLAELSGLSRQAFTAVVEELERLGIVTRIEDPDEPPAKRLVYTQRGHERFAVARGIMADMERAYAQALGPEGYEALRRGLQAVIDTRTGSPAR